MSGMYKSENVHQDLIDDSDFWSSFLRTKRTMDVLPWNNIASFDNRGECYGSPGFHFKTDSTTSTFFFFRVAVTWSVPPQSRNNSTRPTQARLIIFSYCSLLYILSYSRACLGETSKQVIQKSHVAVGTFAWGT